MAIMGRSSASTFGIIFLMCLFLQHETIHAATHVVGGKHRWTFNVADWPNGRTFNAGDVLEFKYSPLFHNVVAVDSDGYNNCIAPTDAEELKSGKDRITLSTGTYYFICSRFDHCSLGMKIAVTAV
ncbi:basic blue protein-like [Carex rostrata]